ncbi:MAG: ferredoxin--NADP(+) reductase [Flavobacteriales bacterium]|nr:MAG: ferredoxin--NADP(+) reductase [Flavobacteriales bacterium]
MTTFSNPIQTDIIIIGSGPAGLFAVFEAGLLGLHCHLIDVLAQPGGQLTEIYPKKPIYDIPGFPSILAGELFENLMLQAAPFKPGFTLGERAEIIQSTPQGQFVVITNKGTAHQAPNIAIAGGLGCFEPRKPPIQNIDDFENNGIEYIIKDPEKYRGKRLVIAGGGDSALDWAIFLQPIASEITLIHRRTTFRGHIDSVNKVLTMEKNKHIRILTNSEVIQIKGDTSLQKVGISTEGKESLLWTDCDYFLPLFGLSPKLGPIANWGLHIHKSRIEVNTMDFCSNIPGIFAIGDINHYPGKLKLILCGFHEATLMAQGAFKRINPDTNTVLRYTTVSGIKGF